MSISKKKKTTKKQIKPVKVVNYNINAANCNVLTMMQYVHCLRSINNQSSAICKQILPVDIEVEYFCNNIIYHHSTSVCIFLQIPCTKSSMNLLRKYGRLSSISFLKSSIPFHSGIFHIPYRNFHTLPCPDFRILPINIGITSASSFFSTLSLPSWLPLPTSFIKVLPLPQKINRFHRFRFQLPLPLPHSCF